MNTKVFVSSTVYDLIDVRAELEHSIRESGLIPVLSDSATSEFTIHADRNSIETCLVNVRASSAIVVILSQRYGPSLLSAGYPDISATHLEYREAVQENVPVRFYVRDRLESDYRHWRGNGRNPDLKYAWVRAPDTRLFDFIHEHQSLVANKGASNWYAVFRNSVDLRQQLMRDLRLPAGRAALSSAIAHNDVPLFQGSAQVEMKGYSATLTCEFTNYGNAPAFNVAGRWINAEKSTVPAVPVIAPNHHFTRVAILSPQTLESGFSDSIEIVSQTSDGHTITDLFDVQCKNQINMGSPGVAYYMAHKSRRYEVGEEPPFVIVAKGDPL